MYLGKYKQNLNALGKFGAMTQKAADLYHAGAWEGTDPVMCEAQGGIVSVSYRTPYQSSIGAGMIPTGGGEIATFSCTYPPQQQQQSPAAVINVPTTVNTTVSPQISPNLIQQDKPTDSGINAGTTQQSEDSFATELLRTIAERGGSAAQPSSAPVFDTTPPQMNIPVAPPKDMTPFAIVAAALIGALALRKKSKQT